MSEQSTTIELEDTGSKGRYFVHSPEGALAEMTFSKVGDHMIIIDHTEVPDAFRGRGTGLRMVTRAVEDARAAGKNIGFGKHQQFQRKLRRTGIAEPGGKIGQAGRGDDRVDQRAGAGGEAVGVIGRNGHAGRRIEIFETGVQLRDEFACPLPPTG